MLLSALPFAPRVSDYTKPPIPFASSGGTRRASHTGFATLWFHAGSGHPWHALATEQDTS